MKFALQLPRDERARLAAELITSLDEMPETGVETAWDSELERIEEVDQEKVRFLEWYAVKDEVMQPLRRR